MFRVDVRGARQILAALPRLVARDLPHAEARRMATRLREVGGVAHVCGSGRTPDFAALEAAAKVEAPAPAQALAPPARRERAKTGDEVAPQRAESAKKAERAAQSRLGADQQAVTAARAAQDAAMANWPEGEAPCAWEASETPPPPVPSPIRHSAARVVWTLVIVLSVAGGSAGAFWMRFGGDVLAVSIAEPHEAPKRQLAAAAPADLGPSRLLLAQQLAAVAGGEAFDALAKRIGSALREEGEPLRVEGHVVGVSFELDDDAVAGALDAHHDEARAASASLLRHVKSSRAGFDRVALLPSTDVPTLARVIGTHGAGLSTEEVVAWLHALETARAIRLLGLGEHFVEGRFATASSDDSERAEVPRCPGAPAPASVSSGAGIADALKSARREDRFSCEWAP